MTSYHMRYPELPPHPEAEQMLDAIRFPPRPTTQVGDVLWNKELLIDLTSKKKKEFNVLTDYIEVWGNSSEQYQEYFKVHREQKGTSRWLWYPEEMTEETIFYFIPKQSGADT